MGLADLVRGGVAIAKKATDDLMDVVEHYPWESADEFEKPNYFPTPFKYRALVEEGPRPHRIPTGETITTRAKITILEPIPPFGGSAEPRQEPIDPRDKIVLPSGFTGPIVDTNNGMVDPTTHRGYMTEVWLA